MIIKKQEISFDQLTDIIVEAILEEKYFNKDQLKYLIRNILTGFQLKLKVCNYNKYFNDTNNENQLMKYERAELEHSFLKLYLKSVLNEKDYITIMNNLDQFKKTIKTNDTKNN